MKTTVNLIPEERALTPAEAREDPKITLSGTCTPIKTKTGTAMRLKGVLRYFAVLLRRVGFRDKTHSASYPQWPDRGDEENWMRGKIAHFQTHHPKDTCRLFDIASGDYLPKSVHIGSHFGVAELKIYRKLKAENPDIVKQARECDGHLFGRSLIYDPDDLPDAPMLQ